MLRSSALLLIASFVVACGDDSTPAAPADASADRPASDTSSVPRDAAADAALDAAAPDTAAPDTIAADAPAPDAPAPDAAVPDAATPDAIAADTVAADAVAGDTVAPDTVAADTVAPDTVAADTVAPDTVSSDASATACSYHGLWVLDTIACGTNDITALWKQTLGIFSALAVDHHAAGGCELAFNNQGASCWEVEGKVWTPTATAGTFDSVSSGIVFCQPMGCTFATGDAPCAMGDRAGTATTTTVTAFTASSMLQFSEADNPLCPGEPAVFTWAWNPT